MAKNFITLGYVYGAFAIVYLLNIVLAVTQNCLVRSQAFDVKYFFSSLVKLFINAVSVGVIIGAFALLDAGLKAGGVKLDDSISSTLSVMTFVLLYAKDFYVSVQSIYNKMTTMFSSENDDEGEIGSDITEEEDVYIEDDENDTSVENVPATAQANAKTNTGTNTATTTGTNIDTNVNTSTSINIRTDAKTDSSFWEA